MKLAIQTIVILMSTTYALSGFALAKVSETYRYDEIYAAIEQAAVEHGAENTLLVFDVDDTLFSHRALLKRPQIDKRHRQAISLPI
jgi:hypothetical protein